MNTYALKSIDTKCPVCNAEQGVILYSVDAEEAAQHYVLADVYPERHEVLREHIESLWQQPTCRIVRCTKCEFCFADPFIAGDARFYTLAYERTGYPKWKWEFERSRERIASLIERGELETPTLLEIGAGNGAFVKSVTPALIPKEQVVCTEYSDYGIHQIREHGLTCLTDDIRTVSLNEHAERYNIICMFQVLEHLDCLDLLFERLNRISRIPAHLFIAVPNDKQIVFNELNGSLLDMPPNHIGRWTRKSFEVIGRRHGWQVIEHAVEPESAVAKIKQYSVYRYLRKRQEPRSLANRIERVPVKVVGRLMKAGAVILYTLGASRFLTAFLTAKGVGDSQWVHLARIEHP